MLHIALILDYYYSGQLSPIDSARLDTLFSKVYQSALNYARSKNYAVETMNGADADDIKQEALLKMYERFSTTYQGVFISLDDFVFYLKADTVNAVKRHVRQYKSTTVGKYEALFLDSVSYEIYQEIQAASNGVDNSDARLWERIDEAGFSSKDVKKVNKMITHRKTTGAMTPMMRKDIQRIVKRYNLKGRKGAE